MEDKFVLLDVGGTQIKAGIGEKSGKIGAVVSYPACSRENKERIFENFAAIIRGTAARIRDGRFSGIGMAFPGPFDYENGVCLIKGLNKYDSIYGMSIIREVQRRVPETGDMPFAFCHDAEAFALGEAWTGLERADRVLCLCIGTGLGSAYIQDGKIVKRGQGVPENGWLYGQPYKGRTIDDYISARGLEKLAERYLGRKADGKELYGLCMQDDPAAKAVYSEFGDELAECLMPFIDSFSPDTVVLGGQIGKSFPYFGKRLSSECTRRNVRLYIEYETSVRAMQGVLRCILEKQGLEV